MMNMLPARWEELRYTLAANESEKNKKIDRHFSQWRCLPSNSSKRWKGLSESSSMLTGGQCL